MFFFNILNSKMTSIRSLNNSLFRFYIHFRNFSLSTLNKQRVVVKYSNAQEYKFQFLTLRRLLKKAYPSLNVVGQQSKNRDGTFEITVDGNLVHSKKSGDGFVDKNDKMQKLSDAIRQSSVNAGNPGSENPSTYQTPIK